MLIGVISSKLLFSKCRVSKGIFNPLRPSIESRSLSFNNIVVKFVAFSKLLKSGLSPGSYPRLLKLKSRVTRLVKSSSELKSLISLLLILRSIKELNPLKSSPKT